MAIVVVLAVAAIGGLAYVAGWVAGASGERAMAEVWRTEWIATRDTLSRTRKDRDGVVQDRVRYGNERDEARRERDRARDLAADLEDRLDGFWALTQKSDGVAGWHQNGDVATWAELELGPDVEHLADSAEQVTDQVREVSR